MRTFAIDLGAKRIGLAISDEGGKYATPLEVLEVNSPDQAISPILALISKERVQRIVIGLPLNMDGTIGPSAKMTIEWSKSLQNAGLQILFLDERLSSFDAEQQLIDRKRAGEKLTRKRKKEQLDAIAAATFLQDFLDGKLRPVNVSI